ncbi:MAG: hypothetical protein E2O84_06065 [Bacteroidetes bacterium]|nr:MAG: hypothetical protein E2O84_06065 [Bacteroidota bacterium]
MITKRFRMKRIATSFAALMVFSVTFVVAQDVTLPNLAPQVVEITGELSISFPSLSRQPLAGFNPPPRVPDIPATRSPFIGEYKQENEDLPPSPLTPPDPPSMSTVSSRTASAGMIEAGIGRYFTGYLRAEMATPIGKSTQFIARADINGTGGREPFPDYNEISTASNSQVAGIGIRSESGKMDFGGDVEVARHDYGLFGALVPGPDLDQKSPDRTIQESTISGFMSSGSRGGSYGELFLGFGQSSVETNQVAYPGISPELPGLDESRFSISGSGGVRASSGILSADFSMARQKLSSDDAPLSSSDLNLSSGNGAVGFTLQYSDQLSISVAARVFGFKVEGDTPSSFDRELVYLTPEFRIGYVVSPGLTVTVANVPEFRESSYAGMYKIAPFIEHGAALQPTLAAANIFAEAAYSSRRFSLLAKAGWKDYQNYRVIEHNSAVTAPYTAGYSSVSYEKASIFYMTAEALLDIVPSLSTGLTVDYFSGKLDNNDFEIPYLSPFSLSSFVAFDPLDGEVLLKGSIRLEAPRYRDRERTLQISRVLSLGFEATYFVTDAAAAVVGVRNLGSKTEFWDNYEMDPGIFYSGLRWRW